MVNSHVEVIRLVFQILLLDPLVNGLSSRIGFVASIGVQDVALRRIHLVLIMLICEVREVQIIHLGLHPH